jgi:hypothetical protein
MLSPEKIMLVAAGGFMLASLGFPFPDIGFGVDGLRRWSVISFAVAAVILSLPLVILAIMPVVERLKPIKPEDEPQQPSLAGPVSNITRNMNPLPDSTLAPASCGACFLT